MNAVIVSYRRGRHVIHPHYAIVKIDGIEDRPKAQALTGKTVNYATAGGKIIKGTITKPHGKKGLVMTHFETGLPGQAIGSNAKVQ